MQHRGGGLASDPGEDGNRQNRPVFEALAQARQNPVHKNGIRPVSE